MEYHETKTREERKKRKRREKERGEEEDKNINFLKFDFTLGKLTSIIERSKRMSSFSFGNFSLRLPAAANTALTALIP